MLSGALAIPTHFNRSWNETDLFGGTDDANVTSIFRGRGVNNVVNVTELITRSTNITKAAELLTRVNLTERFRGDVDNAHDR